jgi:hypothetical protein
VVSEIVAAVVPRTLVSLAAVVTSTEFWVVAATVVFTASVFVEVRVQWSSNSSAPSGQFCFEPSQTQEKSGLEESGMHKLVPGHLHHPLQDTLNGHL